MTVTVTIDVHNQGSYTTTQAILVVKRLHELCGPHVTIVFIKRVADPAYAYTIYYSAEATDHAAAQAACAAVSAPDALKGVAFAPHTSAFLSVVATVL